MKLFNLGSHTGEEMQIQITFTHSEFDSLAALLHKHVIHGERAYSYLAGPAETICSHAAVLAVS